MSNQTIEMGIVKWYGGFNYQKNQENKFGFITRAEPVEDLFVHESGLTCRPDEMKENAIVVFEVIENQRTGKKQAVNVRTVDLFEAEDIQLCLKSNHPEILEQGFEALYNLRTIDENLALTIYERLQRLDGSDLQYMLNHIPYQAFYDYEMLRKLLNTNDRLRLTIELYENSTDEKQKESYFQQMKEWISNDHASIDDSVLEKLPEEMAVLEEIWPYVPVSRKVETLIKQIESKSERDVHLLQELRTYLNDKKYIKRLTPSIKSDLIIFPILNTREQVEIAWGNIANYWSGMNRKAKILSIYRAVKEKRNIFSLISAEAEEDDLVKIILQLVKNEQNLPTRELFYTFQSNLTNYINELLTNLPAEEIIDLRPLLPSCPFIGSSGVLHCEGKRWRTREGTWKTNSNGDEQAFCPRIYKTCDVKTVRDYEGAHIHPVPDLSWAHWTLAELFEALGIQPESYLSIRTDERYILKLAGWVNRLNEIKQRLYCFDCKTPLKPDLTYSKNFARYNITVATCPDCNDKTYFNHCWNCYHIIDSRQSKIMYENYYICIACGAGPQPKYKSEPILPQGSICPNCGTPDMEESPNDANVKKCKKCKHEIHLKGKFKYNDDFSMLNRYVFEESDEPVF